MLAVGVDNIGKVNNVKSSGHDERLRQAILDVMKPTCASTSCSLPSGGIAGGLVGRGTPRPARRPRPRPSPTPRASTTPNADGAVGVDLAVRELGATRIGEIEH